MFKCTGICATCGKCKSQNLIRAANERKTRILSYPGDFAAEAGGIDGGYGIAFDIGTTTVVGMLWDLRSGNMKQAQAATNPQNQYGMDVISRITFGNEKEGNLKILNEAIIGCLNRLIQELADMEGILPSQIVKATICGNQVMSHIVAGYSPRSLAFVPFDPAYTGTLKLDKKTLPLSISDESDITVLPGIAGHVGGDITAGIVASRLLSKKGLSLFIDIGTNGEIVLFDDPVALACSTAAGPAFEGAAIGQGMRAADGAIEKVEITEHDVFFNTIGDGKPVGICGSGLIDAISEMLKAKLINKTGRLLSRQEAGDKGVSPDLAERLRTVDNMREFILVFMESGEHIVITQKDIREIQLANAAIKAGIRLMLSETKKSEADIQNIMVAGAFGNYIDKKSAQNIGLLPPVGEAKIALVGNTAGAGVSMALADGKELERIRQIPQAVRHLDLASCSNFQDVYLEAMSF